jgi:hypothetical protein
MAIRFGATQIFIPQISPNDVERVIQKVDGELRKKPNVKGSLSDGDSSGTQVIISRLYNQLTGDKFAQLTVKAPLHKAHELKTPQLEFRFDQGKMPNRNLLELIQDIFKPFLSAHPMTEDNLPVEVTSEQRKQHQMMTVEESIIARNFAEAFEKSYKK